jgi:hypothetical protein
MKRLLDLPIRAILVLVLLDCTRAVETPLRHDASNASTTVADAAAPGDAARDEKLVADEAVGPLLARLSDDPGNFPSENYVTNETSLLDVAPVLRDPKLKGRAYVGVGPEQNYTYLALIEPRVAYIVDIRRGNLLEHLIFRGCFEAGTTRAEFLSALLARRLPKLPTAGGSNDGFASLEAAFRPEMPDRALRDEGIARTKALLDRLGVVRERGDDPTIERIHAAFASFGLSIAYTMTGTQRAYPTLAETLSAKDPNGTPASFLSSEDHYARVRRLVVQNRVLPIVGDFGRAHALRAVSEDMRERGLLLGAFYTSNVEQYLFESRRHPVFVSSVMSMPHDAESRIVRVWFDQGRPHPAQRPKHRTTQLTISVNEFLSRAGGASPFRSYWEVVNQLPSTP